MFVVSSVWALLLIISWHSAVCLFVSKFNRVQRPNLGIGLCLFVRNPPPPTLTNRWGFWFVGALPAARYKFGNSSGFHIPPNTETFFCIWTAFVKKVLCAIVMKQNSKLNICLLFRQLKDFKNIKMLLVIRELESCP